MYQTFRLNLLLNVKQDPHPLISRMVWIVDFIWARKAVCFLKFSVSFDRKFPSVAQQEQKFWDELKPCKIFQKGTWFRGWHENHYMYSGIQSRFKWMFTMIAPQEWIPLSKDGSFLWRPANAELMELPCLLVLFVRSWNKAFWWKDRLHPNIEIVKILLFNYARVSCDSSKLFLRLVAFVLFSNGERTENRRERRERNGNECTNLFSFTISLRVLVSCLYDTWKLGWCCVVKAISLK